MENGTKRSKILLVASIIGILYVVYLITYFTDAGSSSTGGALATVLVMPHMAFVGLAVIFNVLSYALSNRGFALTSGILYAVSMVLMPIYFMFVIIEMILSFVGFSKLPKKA